MGAFHHTAAPYLWWSALLCSTLMYYGKAVSTWYGALALVYFYVQVFHESHNLMHFAVYDLGLGTETRNYQAMAYCCSLILGFWPFFEYTKEHAHHHVFPNDEELDGAVQTEPFFTMKKARPMSLLAGIRWYTFLFVFGGPYNSIYSIHGHLKNHGLDFPSQVTCIRWALLLWFAGWDFTMRLTMCQYVASGWIFFLSNLNHQHLERYDNESFARDRNYIKHQLESTQSYEIPFQCRFLESIFGGLDMHTTHHIFPRIPWQNLRAVDELVKAKIGSEKYLNMTFGRLVAENWHTATGVEQLG